MYYNLSIFQHFANVQRLELNRAQRTNVANDQIGLANEIGESRQPKGLRTNIVNLHAESRWLRPKGQH